MSTHPQALCNPPNTASVCCELARQHVHWHEQRAHSQQDTIGPPLLSLLIAAPWLAACKRDKAILLGAKKKAEKRETISQARRALARLKRIA